MMNYNIWKLSFNTGVHLGEGRLSDSGSSISADTLFSAFCKEILSSMGEEKLRVFVEEVKEGKLKFTDCFPYKGNSYFLPKPLLAVRFPEENFMKNRKISKKMQYIDVKEYASYLEGVIDLDRYEVPTFGKSGLKVSNSIEKGEATPYHIGVFHFYKDSGLYFISADDNSIAFEIFMEVLEGIGLTGIGGKRSSGLGKFDIIPGNNDLLIEKLKNSTGSNFISLTTSFPKEKEAEVLKEAKYILKRRGGFISSEEYSESPVRKKEFYSLAAGSVFKREFEGDVFDVSRGGSHPVYRYGKPIFMEVE